MPGLRRCLIQIAHHCVCNILGQAPVANVLMLVMQTCFRLPAMILWRQFPVAKVLMLVMQICFRLPAMILRRQFTRISIPPHEATFALVQIIQQSGCSICCRSTRSVDCCFSKQKSGLQPEMPCACIGGGDSCMHRHERCYDYASDHAQRLVFAARCCVTSL